MKKQKQNWYQHVLYHKFGIQANDDIGKAEFDEALEYCGYKKSDIETVTYTITEVTHTAYTIDSNGEITCTPIKEDAISEIKQQPFFR